MTSRTLLNEIFTPETIGATESIEAFLDRMDAFPGFTMKHVQQMLSYLLTLHDTPQSKKK